MFEPVNHDDGRGASLVVAEAAWRWEELKRLIDALAAVDARYAVALHNKIASESAAALARLNGGTS